MCNLFKDCKSLKKEPPILNWIITNLIDDFGIFDGCNF